MQNYHVDQRFKSRSSKRKANVVKVEFTPTAGDFITLEFEDDGTRLLVSETNLRLYWYNIPKGEGKRRGDKEDSGSKTKDDKADGEGESSETV